MTVSKAEEAIRNTILKFFKASEVGDLKTVKELSTGKFAEDSKNATESAFKKGASEMLKKRGKSNITFVRINQVMEGASAIIKVKYDKINVTRTYLINLGFEQNTWKLLDYSVLNKSS